mgnify:FL=1
MTTRQDLDAHADMHAIVAGLRIDLVAVSTGNTANILLRESQEVAAFDAAAAPHIVVVAYIQLLLLLLGRRLGSKDLTIIGAGMASLECARQLLEVVEFNNKIVARIARLVHRWIWKYGRPACRQDTVPNLHHTKRGNDDGQQINFNTTTLTVFLTYVTSPGTCQSTCPVRFNIGLKVRFGGSETVDGCEENKRFDSSGRYTQSTYSVHSFLPLHVGMQST